MNLKNVRILYETYVSLLYFFLPFSWKENKGVCASHVSYLYV